VTLEIRVDRMLGRVTEGSTSSSVSIRCA